MNLGRSTCGPGPDCSGPRSAVRGRSPAGRHGRGCERPTAEPPEVRHLFAAYELGEDKLSGRIKPRKTPGPGSWSSAFTCARSSHRLSGSRSSATTAARISAPAGPPCRHLGHGEQHRDRLHADEFILLNRSRHSSRRCATRAGRHRPPSHKEQTSMIRRYIIWRNNHTYDERLRRIVDRANVA